MLSDSFLSLDIFYIYIYPVKIFLKTSCQINNVFEINVGVGHTFYWCRLKNATFLSSNNDNSQISSQMSV